MYVAVNNVVNIASFAMDTQHWLHFSIVDVPSIL
jgi:hypothetical protein